MFFILIVLALFNLSDANAGTFVETLFAKGQSLKTVGTVAGAKTEVGHLRESLSSAPLKRDATDEERASIIQTIVATETAAMLIDGAYDFQFNRTAYALPVGILSERDQIHYGWIFCLARTSQLLAENPAFDQADISLLLDRDTQSRHMPAWMREVFQKTLRHIDWVSYVRPYLAVQDFALTETRSQERKAEKGRLQFTVKITAKHSEESSKSHEGRGIPFAKSAFLKPGNYTFDAFAIDPNGACMFYGCQGSHGYFERRNFGEQILDNLDSDPYLEDLVKGSIAYDPYVWEVQQRAFAYSTLKAEFQGKKTLSALLEELHKPLDMPAGTSGEEKEKAYELRDMKIKGEIKKGLTTASAKKIVERETNTPLFKTAFCGNVSYVDVMAYLNSLNIYVFGKADTPGALRLDSHEAHVSYANGRSAFLLSASDHVTRLVRRDGTMASLFEYIKAKAHEDNHRTVISASYERNWM